ncbi:uncharacterized protein LOC123312896 [Coccinella septempunctata]|uniref:uncharacterized protein LOC123312896 n=1 Tax=Coccinella septempunctata TaxID=41139 RepID=UPI001D07436D|nr:uncharacterized protein LOC123312896 [Coccinella septempunctata]
MQHVSSPIVLGRLVKKVVKFECKKVIEQVLIAWTLAPASPPGAHAIAPTPNCPPSLRLSPISVSLVAIFRAASGILFYIVVCFILSTGRIFTHFFFVWHLFVIVRFYLSRFNSYKFNFQMSRHKS